MWHSYRRLPRYRGVYIGGGNTFRLLDIVRRSGLMPALRTFMDNGRRLRRQCSVVALHERAGEVDADGVLTSVGYEPVEIFEVPTGGHGERPGATFRGVRALVSASSSVRLRAC